jgi:hypothetical protein
MSGSLAVQKEKRRRERRISGMSGEGSVPKGRERNSIYFLSPSLSRMTYAVERVDEAFYGSDIKSFKIFQYSDERKEPL